MNVPAVTVTVVYDPIAAMPCEPVMQDFEFPALSACMWPLRVFGGTVLCVKKLRGIHAGGFRVLPLKLTTKPKMALVQP